MAVWGDRMTNCILIHGRKWRLQGYAGAVDGESAETGWVVKAGASVRLLVVHAIIPPA